MKTPTLTITGEISKISPTKTNDSGTFRSRKLWLKYDDSYERNGELVENPNFPEFDFKQDKCDELDNFKPGDTVAISFNPKGRPWTTPDGVKKIIRSNDAWKIEVEGNTQPELAHVVDAEDTDDLPF